MSRDYAPLLYSHHFQQFLTFENWSPNSWLSYSPFSSCLVVVVPFRDMGFVWGSYEMRSFKLIMKLIDYETATCNKARPSFQNKFPFDKYYFLLSYLILCEGCEGVNRLTLQLTDYLHITKRFGMIAASQFPLHYMLSMKSSYSPLALIFKVSHEELNPYHRLSGRIIYLLLCLHATWYMNFFVQAGVLQKRLAAPVVIIGILVFLSLTTIVTTALAPIRRWSYRVFFIIHLVLGISILPMLFFHAPHLRIYMLEALALFIFDIVCRKLDTITGYATITPIPNTSLIQVKIPVPATKLKRFHAAPGQHVYISIPPSSTPPNTSTPSVHDFLFNPFTISSVSSKDITLVLRSLNGPTTNALKTLSKMPKAKPPLSIEGPLGSSKYFPDLAQSYDRILLVAGGVGATFILPLYTHFQEKMESAAKSPDRVSFIWSLRDKAEAEWVVDSSAGVGFAEDEGVQIFLTGDSSVEETVLPSPGLPRGEGEGVEMATLSKPSASSGLRIRGGYARPDFGKIVDGVFRIGGEERVAVFVCGPEGMARDVRREVGRWVGKGRDVWFHDEGFGW